MYKRRSLVKPFLVQPSSSLWRPPTRGRCEWVSCSDESSNIPVQETGFREARRSQKFRWTFECSRNSWRFSSENRRVACRKWALPVPGIWAPKLWIICGRRRGPSRATTRPSPSSSCECRRTKSRRKWVARCTVNSTIRKLMLMDDYISFKYDVQ